MGGLEWVGTHNVNGLDLRRAGRGFPSHAKPLVPVHYTQWLKPLGTMGGKSGVIVSVCKNAGKITFH